MIRAALTAAVALVLGLVVPATAQPLAIAVGKFTSEKSCTTYVLNYGRESASSSSSAAGYAGVFGGGYAGQSASSYSASWGQYLVRDCQNNFLELRQSMERALAASGKFTVVPAGRAGALVLTGHMSDVGGASTATRGSGYAVASSDAVISVEYSLVDGRGRTVFGNLVTKHLNTATGIGTSGISTVSAQDGRTIYTQIQREVALAVARSVCFRQVPLRVVDVEGNRVRLNYGAPFVALGATIQVDAGMSSMKFNVTSASGDSAIAELDGGGDVSRIPPGATATYIEADDPAANGRRYQRVDIP